ncbi:hypothetical protein [Brackiella oedipodis]|uniref:hypothetical protein n=1 Tax=Brackiella oedipodis TaxID=124225 RepID=UPI00048C0DA7|nr:hypothetical protein [Brackiella oedipodis]
MSEESSDKEIDSVTNSKNQIINDWFCLSQEKLTPNDPTVTLLLSIKNYIDAQQKSEKSDWQTLLTDLDTRKHELEKIANALVNTKENLLIELDLINRKNVHTFASEIAQTVASSEKIATKAKTLNSISLGLLCLNLFLLIALLIK